MIRIVSWFAAGLALATAVTPGTARADDPPPPPPGSAPIYGPPPGAAPVYGPPASTPPTYPPPPYAQPYAAPIYAPEEITDFDDSAPVPYGYTRVQRMRKGPIIGGAVTLGATYLVTALAATFASAVHDVEGSNTDVGPMFVPVVGPFLETQQTDSSVARFWLLVLGAGQTTGAVLLVYGLTSPRTILVRNDQLSLAPMLGRGVSGLTLTGRF